MIYNIKRFFTSALIIAITAIMICVACFTQQGCSSIEASRVSSTEHENTTKAVVKETTTIETEIQTTEAIAKENAANVVDISINPQIRLFLDGDDRIIAYDFLNDDAEKYYGDITLINESFVNVAEVLCKISAENNLGMENSIMEIDFSQIHYSSVYANTAVPEYIKTVEEAVKSSLSSINVVVTNSNTYVSEYDADMIPIQEKVVKKDGETIDRYYESGRVYKEVKNYFGSLLSFSVAEIYGDGEGYTEVTTYNNGIIFTRYCSSYNNPYKTEIDFVENSEAWTAFNNGTADYYTWETGGSFTTYSDTAKGKTLYTYYLPGGNMIIKPIYSDKGIRIGTDTFDYKGNVVMSVRDRVAEDTLDSFIPYLLFDKIEDVVIDENSYKKIGYYKDGYDDVQRMEFYIENDVLTRTISYRKDGITILEDSYYEFEDGILVKQTQVNHNSGCNFVTYTRGRGNKYADELVSQDGKRLRYTTYDSKGNVLTEEIFE